MDNQPFQAQIPNHYEKALLNLWDWYKILRVLVLGCVICVIAFIVIGGIQSNLFRAHILEIIQSCLFAVWMALTLTLVAWLFLSPSMIGEARATTKVYLAYVDRLNEAIREGRKVLDPIDQLEGEDQDHDGDDHQLDGDNQDQAKELSMD